MALYMMGCYGDEAETAWFRAAYLATGKKLDMGKACLRFKKADDLALDVIGEAIARVTPEAYIARYDAVRAAAKR
jgi:hypothetical protein